MFCPKCGTQNLIEQKYCRACGHKLAAHIAALEGRTDDVSIPLNKGSQFVAIGLIVTGIVKLNLLANFFFRSDATGIIINLLILLLIAVPLITIGMIRISQARRALNPKAKADDKAITAADLNQLPAAADTDRSISIPSVTEHTTLELKVRR
ncbi:MAG: zinc ribbon domain-containing protein [Blastocatellia bacterium]